MSGGSYNYLAYADTVESLKQRMDELEQMQLRLEALGLEAEAMATHDLITTVKTIDEVVAGKAKKLQEIFQAVEWMDSGDSGYAEVEEAHNNFRF